MTESRYYRTSQTQQGLTSRGVGVFRKGTGSLTFLKSPRRHCCMVEPTSGPCGLLRVPLSCRKKHHVYELCGKAGNQFLYHQASTTKKKFFLSNISVLQDRSFAQKIPLGKTIPNKVRPVKCHIYKAESSL